MNDQTETQQNSTELTDKELDDVQGGATLRKAADAGAAPKSIGAKLQAAWKQMSRSAVP